MNRYLVIMVKDPLPGRAKTRLAKDIGTIEATAWYRWQCRAMIRRLRDPRWQMILAVSPDRTQWPWPVGVSIVGQGRGDIGERMFGLIRRFGGAPVLLVGSDIPDLSKRYIVSGFKALGRPNQVVIGPASDGGYWGIGMRGQIAKQRFDLRLVRWSTQYAREDTIRALGPGAEVALLDCLSDVDTAADLQ